MAAALRRVFGGGVLISRYVQLFIVNVTLITRISQPVGVNQLELDGDAFRLCWQITTAAFSQKWARTRASLKTVTSDEVILLSISISARLLHANNCKHLCIYFGVKCTNVVSAPYAELPVRDTRGQWRVVGEVQSWWGSASDDWDSASFSHNCFLLLQSVFLLFIYVFIK